MPKIETQLQEQFIKILCEFEEKLKNQEIKDKLANLIDDFSKIERSEFIKRYSTLANYVEELCGKNTAFILFDILSKSKPDVLPLLAQINDQDVREWLSELNRKYISRLEGCFPPFLNDWYRVLWTIKLDQTHGNVAFIETTILKRNKETVFLDTPFANMLVLINHWLTQICTTNIVNVTADTELKAQLEKTKKIVEQTLNSTLITTQPTILDSDQS